MINKFSWGKDLSDTLLYPKQFRIRNPIRHSLPITPSDRIFYPKPFRIKNPIRRGFLKKTLSDRISYPKPFRIENPIRIARRMKSRIPASRFAQRSKSDYSEVIQIWFGEKRTQISCYNILTIQHNTHNPGNELWSLQKHLFRCASISWIHVWEWVSHSCFWDFVKSWAYLQAIFRVCSG